MQAGVYELKPIADGVVEVLFQGFRCCILHSYNPVQYVEANQDSFLSEEARLCLRNLKQFSRSV